MGSFLCIPFGHVNPWTPCCIEHLFFEVPIIIVCTELFFFWLKVMRWKKKCFWNFFFKCSNVQLLLKRNHATGAHTHNTENSKPTYQIDFTRGAWIFLWHFFQIQHWNFIVLYNVNIMQQADYIYANLLSAIIPCAGCMDFTDYSVYYSFWLISPAHLSSSSASLISPIWLVAHFFHDLFYSNCKIVVKCNI